MSGDDDDGSVIIIQGKIKKALTALKAPVTSLKRWHVIAIALVAFVVGLAL